MITVYQNDAPELCEEVSMFEDSLSEGHVYYGRMLAIIAIVIAVAYVVASL